MNNIQFHLGEIEPQKIYLHDLARDRFRRFGVFDAVVHCSKILGTSGSANDEKNCQE
jgi:hypothetical protein